MRVLVCPTSLTTYSRIRGVLFPGGAQASQWEIWSVCGLIHSTEYHVFCYFWAQVCSLLFLLNGDFHEDIKTYITSKFSLLVMYVLYIHESAYVGRIRLSKLVSVCWLDFEIPSKFCMHSWYSHFDHALCCFQPIFDANYTAVHLKLHWILNQHDILKGFNQLFTCIITRDFEQADALVHM